MAQRLSEDSTDVCLSPLYVTLIVCLFISSRRAGGRSLKEKGRHAGEWPGMSGRRFLYTLPPQQNDAR